MSDERFEAIEGGPLPPFPGLRKQPPTIPPPPPPLTKKIKIKNSESIGGSVREKKGIMLIYIRSHWSVLR